MSAELRTPAKPRMSAIERMSPRLRRPTPAPGRFSLDRFTYLILCVPALLLYLYFVIYPLGLGFYYSLTDWNGVGKEYRLIGFENYAAMFADPLLRDTVGFTLRYTLIVVVGVTVISLALALLINEVRVARSLVRSVFFFPAVLSLVTVGLIFNEIYYRAVPEVGKALGIDALSTSVLSDKSTAIWGIALVNIWQGVALPSIIFLAGLQSVPQELTEAAAIDGANYLQRFRNVFFPFLVPSLQLVLILALKSGILVFDYIMVTTGGGPGRATTSIAQLIVQNAFGGSMRFSYAITQSFGLFVFMIGFSLIQFGVFARKDLVQ